MNSRIIYINSIVLEGRGSKLKFYLFFIILICLSHTSHSKLLSSQEIADICHSDDDIYLVDIFKHRKPTLGYQQDKDHKNDIDLDGDGLPDVMHGDFVAKVFELNQRPLKTYGIKNFGKSGIQGALGDLRHYIRIKQIKKPAAIILALSQSYSLEKIAIELLGNQNAPITMSNIDNYAEQIIAGIKETLGDHHSLYSFYRDVKDLEKLGVPVVIAAGNDYSTTINLASLMGATSIGALDLNGEVAAYSNENLYVNIYRPGDYISRELPGGIDINNDGIVDFESSLLTGQTKLKDWVSNNQPQILSISEAQTKLKESFLIESNDFHQFTGVSDQAILSQYDQTYGDVVHYPSNMSFFKQPDGTLVFNPAKDNSSDQVAINSGTSFAIGSLCN